MASKACIQFDVDCTAFTRRVDTVVRYAPTWALRWLSNAPGELCVIEATGQTSLVVVPSWRLRLVALLWRPLWRGRAAE